MSRSFPEDPYGETPLTGDHPPGGDDWLQNALPAHLEDNISTWNSGLPEGHEPVIEIDDEEIPADSLKLRILEKTREYGVTVVREAREHPKTTAAATTITVAALMLAIKSTHSRKKSK